MAMVAFDELVADHACVAPGDMELAFGAGGGNVEEAPLFGAGVGALSESDRNITVLNADQVHDRPFEALGRMEGAELDAIGDGGDTIVGAQRREEVVDGGRRSSSRCPRAMSRNAWSIAGVLRSGGRRRASPGARWWRRPRRRTATDRRARCR